MAQFLHIGSNDAIGRSLKYSTNVQVISHHDAHDIDFSEFEVISLSAFDPSRKKRLKPSDITELLKARCSAASTKILYYSTCRVFDDTVNERHLNYVRNKVSDEVSLLDHFSNVSIVYLPIIIPTSVKDNSPFFKNLFMHLSHKRVRFDVSGYSTWNFIHASEFSRLLHYHHQLDKRQTLVSQTSIAVNQILDHFGVSAASWSVELGDLTTHFPSKNTLPRWIAQNDAGLNLTWLTELKALYNV